MTADDSALPETNSDAPAPLRPFLRVVSGNPTDEELAVLVSLIAGVAAGGGNAPDPSTEPRNDWGRPVDRLRPSWGSASSFTNLRY